MLAVLLATAAGAQSTPPSGAVPPEGAAPPPAPQAGTYSYHGFHPLPPGHGAFCTTPGPHAHSFAPADMHVFVLWDGTFVFVGDPNVFGYTGAVYSYSGPHPLPWGGWCDISGPHHHLFAPDETYFVLQGPYWVYETTVWGYWPRPYPWGFCGWAGCPYCSFHPFPRQPHRTVAVAPPQRPRIAEPPRRSMTIPSRPILQPPSRAYFPHR
jgi:hypothetical protein